MLTGRKDLLDLTAEQAGFAERIGGVCRAVWNTALEQRRACRRRGAFISYAEQARQLAQAKRELAEEFEEEFEEELEWLAEVPGHCLQQTLIDLDTACSEHGTWRVRWESKTRGKPSFRFPEGKRITVERLNRGWVRGDAAEAGVGAVPVDPGRWAGPSRTPPSRKEGRRWYISFLVDDGIQTPDRHAHPDRRIGVDRGVARIVTTGDGEFYHRVFATGREITHAARLQRDLSRTGKGSKRRRRAAQRAGAFSARVRRRREDFAVKTAHVLTTGHGLIVFESLQTKNMTARAKPKPDPDQPGAYLPNGAAAKTGLNRSILDKGRHRIERATAGKARYTGTHVITVNPAYTSVTCHACKHVDAKSRKSQAAFACTTCGHKDHADVNAANNILTAATAEPHHPDRGRGLGRANHATAWAGRQTAKQQRLVSPRRPDTRQLEPPGSSRGERFNVRPSRHTWNHVVSGETAQLDRSTSGVDPGITVRLVRTEPRHGRPATRSVLVRAY